MAAIDWQYTSQVVQGVGSILSVLLAGWAAIAVQRYTKRKDRLDYFNHRWQIQQEINIQKLCNPKMAVEFERMVYGAQAQVTEEGARKNYIIFLVLNLVQSDWFAFKEGMISRQEWDQYGFATLNLVAQHADTVIYLVKHRGYTSEFSDEVVRILGRAAPVPPIQ